MKQERGCFTFLKKHYSGSKHEDIFYFRVSSALLHILFKEMGIKKGADILYFKIRLCSELFLSVCTLTQ